MTNEPSVEQLKAQLAAFEAKVSQLEQSNKTLKDNNKSLQCQIDLLISKLNLSNSKRFGRQSEKKPKGTFNEAEHIKSECICHIFINTEQHNV